MKDLPAEVLHAVELKLDDVEQQLREMPLATILSKEDLEWSFGLGDGWHMFAEINRKTAVLEPSGLHLDLRVSAGRRLARPRTSRRVHLKRTST